MTHFSSRQVGSILIVLLGTSFVLSGVFVNPWFGKLWYGNQVIDRLDVLSGYFCFSMAVGWSTILVGGLVSRRRGGWVDCLAILIVVCGMLLLLDRLLLVKFNLTIYEHDPVLHYRYRPNAVRTLSLWKRPDDLVRINKFGHHDTDFDKKKPPNEFRALMIGDSVTMGWGLIYEQTFSKKLEDLLERQDKYESYQVINTGVHGYAPFQELQVLKESLIFEPDFIAVGFVMNDVTEPFVINKDYGGVGIDYHGVVQTSSTLFGFLMNETGLGRLVQKQMSRSLLYEQEKRQEVYNVRHMAESSASDPGFSKNWEYTLKDLAAIYSVAKREQIPIVLMIFPYTFQLNNSSLQTPQKILREHARDHAVDVIDFTDIFTRLIYDDRALLLYMEEKGYDDDEVNKFFRWKRDEYFFDEDHFTERGNQVVAKELYSYLVGNGIVNGG